MIEHAIKSNKCYSSTKNWICSYKFDDDTMVFNITQKNTMYDVHYETWSFSEFEIVYRRNTSKRIQ